MLVFSEWTPALLSKAVDVIRPLWSSSSAQAPELGATPGMSPQSLEDVQLVASPYEAPLDSTDDQEPPLVDSSQSSLAPVVVAAASCQDVVVRWQALEDPTRPVSSFVVQRYPDSHHEARWGIVAELNGSSLVDKQVQPPRDYLYRVQAVRGRTRSPFAYFSVRMNEQGCRVSTPLLAILPASLNSLPLLSSLSVEAVQTFLLICTCLLAAFATMRRNVKRVQNTKTRRHRLRRMDKSALAASAFLPPLLSPRSSSESSTDPSTSATDLQSSMASRRDSSVSLSLRSSIDGGSSPMGMPQRSASFATVADKPEHCHFCRKKFGIFRRRRVCDVCQEVALCRKCGFHSPVDCSLEELRESLAGRETLSGRSSMISLRASKYSPSDLSRRVKTICRDCCGDVQRFTIAPSARPSIYEPLR
ncbi:hypothetical protein P43SY_000834 [Pythium insidiosum]|uniref:Fibronectin type-III domain-containing protein n=1 Tax=Pythium insidiosum TaxID=114742 RepID=A0AAD5M0V3_PYTIN|nr:hypothetical protein P43SY_000834 [Pythium insidiosum]